jgi:hypothetical protein
VSTAAAQVSTSSKSPVPSGPLTRAELLARGDAVCYRLNTRRQSTLIARPSDYERQAPALAAYELTGATELGELTPPASMAQSWQHIVAGARTVATVTGRFPHFAQASSDAIGHRYDAILGKAIDEMVNAAKRSGFKECSRFL